MSQNRLCSSRLMMSASLAQSRPFALSLYFSLNLSLPLSNFLSLSLSFFLSLSLFLSFNLQCVCSEPSRQILFHNVRVLAGSPFLDEVRLLYRLICLLLESWGSYSPPNMSLNQLQYHPLISLSRPFFPQLPTVLHQQDFPALHHQCP